MVIDRALYLRKTVVGKLIFQVLLVFGIHFWMFFILPSVTDRYPHPTVPLLYLLLLLVLLRLLLHLLLLLLVHLLLLLLVQILLLPLSKSSSCSYT